MQWIVDQNDKNLVTEKDTLRDKVANVSIPDKDRIRALKHLILMEDALIIYRLDRI